MFRLNDFEVAEMQAVPQGSLIQMADGGLALLFSQSEGAVIPLGFDASNAWRPSPHDRSPTSHIPFLPADLIEVDYLAGQDSRLSGSIPSNTEIYGLATTDKGVLWVMGKDRGIDGALWGWSVSSGTKEAAAVGLHRPVFTKWAVQVRDRKSGRLLIRALSDGSVTYSE